MMIFTFQTYVTMIHMPINHVSTPRKSETMMRCFAEVSFAETDREGINSQSVLKIAAQEVTAQQQKVKHNSVDLSVMVIAKINYICVIVKLITGFGMG